MTSVVRRTKLELERLFIEAYQRLDLSCKSYDRGHFSEAPDIAKEIANFVYDHGRTISILSGMGIKKSTEFICSAIHETKGESPDVGTLMSNEYYIISARICFSGMDYVPFLNRKSKKYINFSEWWNGHVLSRYHAPLLSREFISRSEIVIFTRNKEGGGHVETQHHIGTKDDKLIRLMAGEYVDGYMILDGQETITAEDNAPPYATLRQIGWELQETLNCARPDLVVRAMQPPVPGPRMVPGKR
ncbi:hypothetical protein V5F44_19150 [Xanthobacter sp. V2C-8]|uniref:hypothetical protein n=1 Tax=Xanthobacter albus TaxID=3119929 RepID=UPI003728C40C